MAPTGAVHGAVAERSWRLFCIWELHKVLHTHINLHPVQVNPKDKAPICGAFAEPSDGLEPSTPSLP
jgi:hypothetical protein